MNSNGNAGNRNASSQLVPAVIEPDVLYHKAELMARLRWKQHAWRTARKQGLRVLRAGGRVYVRGQDVIDHLYRLNGGGQRDG